MEKQNKRNQYSYDKKAYDHAHIQLPKGTKQTIQDIATAQGYSLNLYVKKALQNQIKADTGKDIEL